jgi:hypothetical protein
MFAAYIEEHLRCNFFNDFLKFFEGNLSSLAKDLFNELVNFVLTFNTIDKQVSIQDIS